MSATVPQLLRSAAAAQREGCAVAACMIVSAHGSTPQSAGAIMFVDDLARIFGTIGGGCIEAEIRRRAMTMLGEDESCIARFALDSDYGWDDGLICGGTVHVAIAAAPAADELERVAADVEGRRPARLEIEVDTEDGCEIIALHLPPRPRLYIAGAGHIGQAAARHALALDFDVTLFDDRPDLLARFAAPLRTVSGPIAAKLAGQPMDESTYVLIVTRGHRHDAQALAAVIDREARYIGMIGSRRKIKVIFDELEARGVDRERLDRVFAPVGVDIAARTIEEIAVSIAAQLVQVRRAGGAAGSEPTIERVKADSLHASMPSCLHASAPIGVLLAAGRARRMGRTKQVLQLPGDPRGRALVAAAFDAIAPICGHMVVVLAHDAARVRAALAGRSFTEAHAPPNADMTESLLTGLRHAAAIDADAPVLLHLADHPRIGESTLVAMQDAAAKHPGRAVIPTFNNRGGHPVLIPAALSQFIRDQSAMIRQGGASGGGLRELWNRRPELCLRLPVDDASIVLDIDVPEEYRRMMGSTHRGIKT